VEEALWGLAASGLLYLAGSLLWVQTARLWWAEQPEELHGELRRLRDEARNWKLSLLFRPPERRSVMWLASAALLFALLWALDFGLLFQVLYVLGLSLWWMLMTLDAQRAENRKLWRRLGVEPASTNGFRRVGFLASFYLFGFMIAAGTVGAACFVGGVIAAAID
jgi:hypothetical protein